MSLASRLCRLLPNHPVTMHPAQAARLAEENRALLLDVRELGEWLAGSGPQARHAPLGQLPDPVGALGRPGRVI